MGGDKAGASQGFAVIRLGVWALGAGRVGSICSGEPRAVASRESPEAAGGKDGACIQDQLTFRGLKSKVFTKAMVYISVRKKKSSNTASV